MCKPFALCAALLGWQLLASDCSLAQGIQTIALTGDPVPGIGNGATLSGFRPPDFNNRGQVAFTGTIVEVTRKYQAMLFGSANDIQPIALGEDQAPGTPSGVNFVSFFPLLPYLPYVAPQLNDDGTVAFMGTLASRNRDNPVTPNNSLGLWSWNAGNTELVLRGEDPLPNGQDGEVLGRDFIMANMNAAGNVAFYGYSQVDIADRYQGFWRTESGTPYKVAVASIFSPDEIPGYPGFRFSYGLNDVNATNLDDLGRLNFEAYYHGPAGLSSGIWREDSGQYELLVHSGQAATGEVGDVTFAAISYTEFNSVGQSVFRAQLAGADVTDANNEGIWYFNGTSVEKIVRSGDAVPGLPGDFIFGQSVPYDVSDSGGAVFTAQLLNGSSESAGMSLWKYAEGNIDLVVRAGDPAPGTEPGMTFSSFLYLDPEINARNQAAFLGQITGDGIDTSNDFGLWAQDMSGQLRLIVREGDQLEVQPGDLRTISRIDYDTFYSPLINRSRTSYLNDQGQVVFVATFTDGSQGMFISNLVAVPEPGAAVLAIFGLTAAGCRRRR